MRNSSMTIRRAQLVALGIVLASPLVALAQVYKWTDDKGVVNYSSTPPDNRKSQKLDEDKGRVSTIEAYDASKSRRRAPGTGPEGSRGPARAGRAAQSPDGRGAGRDVGRGLSPVARALHRRPPDRLRQPRGRIRPGLLHALWSGPACGRCRSDRVPASSARRRTSRLVAGGVVGPYLKPPPSGVVVGPGPGGVGAAYGPAPPGGVVVITRHRRRRCAVPDGARGVFRGTPAPAPPRPTPRR